MAFLNTVDRLCCIFICYLEGIRKGKGNTLPERADFFQDHTDYVLICLSAAFLMKRFKKFLSTFSWHIQIFFHC